MFVVNVASAEVKYLDDVIRSASPSEKSDLSKLLNDLQLQPETDPDSGKSVFRVKSVAAGSIYERAGIKPGDLVATGSAKKKQFQKLGFKKGEVIKSINGEEVTSPAQAMEIYNKARESGATEVTTEQ